MKNLTLKKIVLCALALIVGIFTICGPAFALVSLYGVEMTGYDIIPEASEMGGVDAENDLALAASFIMMLIGIFAVVLPIVALFLFDEKKTRVACNCTLWGGLVSSLLYTIAGGVLKGSDNISYLDGVKTVAFVPMILIVLLTVAFIVCDKMMQSKPLTFKSNVAQQEVAATSTSRPVQDESATVELLIKYKKLLDEGIITQEEFDEKKSQLL